MKEIPFYGYIILLFFASLIGCNKAAIDSSGFLQLSDGYNMHYAWVGKGSKHVIVPAGFLLKDDFAHLFDLDIYTVVFYDMRNRGASETEYDSLKLSIQQDVRDLEEVRSHFGFKKVSLIGYSYLGLMVGMYTQKYPDKVTRIVQLGPVPFRSDLSFSVEYNSPDTSEIIDKEALARLAALRKENFHLTHPKEYCLIEWKTVKHSLIGNPAKASLLGDGPCEYPNEWPIHLARHFYHHFNSVLKVRLSNEQLQIITVPVLILHGTKDRNAPFGSGREWAYRLPDAKLIPIKGAAHNSWIDAPDLVRESIITFLNGTWPAQAIKIEESSLK